MPRNLTEGSGCLAEFYSLNEVFSCFGFVFYRLPSSTTRLGDVSYPGYPLSFVQGVGTVGRGSSSPASKGAVNVSKYTRAAVEVHWFLERREGFHTARSAKHEMQNKIQNIFNYASVLCWKTPPKWSWRQRRLKGSTARDIPRACESCPTKLLLEAFAGLAYPSSSFPFSLVGKLARYLLAPALGRLSEQN